MSVRGPERLQLRLPRCLLDPGPTQDSRPLPLGDQEGLLAVELINREAAGIVREASQRLWLDNPELILPGGNAYTTRRLAACLRDMDYFLRYASYALVADDLTILDERVLNGLDDTYKSLGVPTGPTVRSIALLADVVAEMLADAGLSEAAALARAPFDHLCRGLAASDVRAR